TWMPIFFWLLDTAIVNSYLVYQIAAARSTMTQVMFRLDLVWDLIKLANDKEKGNETQRKTRNQVREESMIPDPPPRKHCITKSHNLDPARLTPGDHFLKYQEKREACIWCHYLGKIGRIE